jgi:hypothetical protein
MGAGQAQFRELLLSKPRPAGQQSESGVIHELVKKLRAGLRRRPRGLL